jgi:hypothetical protein
MGELISLKIVRETKRIKEALERGRVPLTKTHLKETLPMTDRIISIQTMLKELEERSSKL